MTEKLLPPGVYIMRVMVIGSAHIDGSVLVSRWGTPAAPARFADAARAAIAALTPPQLERIAAGSWLLVGLDHKTDTLAGQVIADQVAIAAEIERADFEARLGAEVPPVIERLATTLIASIGIEPIQVAAVAGRPALLH